MSDADFEALLAIWFGNAARVLRPGGGFYIWGGFMNLPNYPPALKAAGLYFSQAIIWVKEHPVLTRKDFMTNHELAFCGWREGAAHRFFGPPNVPDVWPAKKVSPNKMVHLTEEPVELARRAIECRGRSSSTVRGVGLDAAAGCGGRPNRGDLTDERHRGENDHQRRRRRLRGPRWRAPGRGRRCRMRRSG